MIKNYLKVALRAIVRNRLSSFINLMGLTLAMASAILIYLFIVDEIGYDSYNAKADRTYRVTREFFIAMELQPFTYAPLLRPLVHFSKMILPRLM